MGVRERGDQFRRLARSAIADLFDQRKPFGRLALTHVLMTAGDTIFAVSLAGSLFFSISPMEAKDKVLLYLLLTMAPFAVVAPALGPLIDRSRGARRAMVVVSALGRAVLCPFLARDLHSLLLFPEAFAMLVLSKVYLVSKGALVPEMVAQGLLGPVSDAPGSDPAVSDPTRSGDTESDPRTTAPLEPEDPPDPESQLQLPLIAETPPGGTPAVHPVPAASPAGRTAASPEHPDLAGLNARLGLLASLSAFVFALPAAGLLKLGGASSVIWFGFVVFLVAVAAAARLPVRRSRSIRGALAGAEPDAAPGSTGADVVVTLSANPTTSLVGRQPVSDGWDDDEDDLAPFRPIANSEVMLALMPMSALKALMGFLTFLVAFGLRREDAATWWFGLLLGSITAGALIGVLLVSRIRRVLSEQQILVGSLWLVAVCATVGAVEHARLVEVVVALGVGIAGAVAKPSFDALVQQFVPESNQGRAFARFETRLQLVWVVGAFVPVVLTLPLPAGNLIMAVFAAVTAVFYLTSRRAVRRYA